MIEQLANKHGLVVAKTIATTQAPVKTSRVKRSSTKSETKESRVVKPNDITDLLNDAGLPRSFNFNRAFFGSSRGHLYYKPGDMFVTIMHTGGDLLIGISATYKLYRKDFSSADVNVEFYRANLKDALKDTSKIVKQLKLAIKYADRFANPAISRKVYEQLFQRKYKYDDETFKMLAESTDAEASGHKLVKLDLDIHKYQVYPHHSAYSGYFVEQDPAGFKRELRDLVIRSSREFDQMLAKYKAKLHR